MVNWLSLNHWMIQSVSSSLTHLWAYSSMDTLSSSVSSIKVPSLHPKSSFHEQPLFHFKNHLLSQNPNFISASSIKPRKNSNYSKTAASNFIPFPSPVLEKNSTSSSPQAKQSHRRAPTGYAATLLDVARCGNVLETVAYDVKRLSRWLHSSKILHDTMADPFLDEKEKGEIIKEIMEKGKFHKHLVKLVKLLIRKTNFEIAVVLSEVLEEFQRLYDELSVCTVGRRTDQVVVFVSPFAGTVKMDEDQVLGIAKRIQKLTGALKVKVRQLAN